MSLHYTFEVILVMSARNIIHNSLEELFESRAKKYFLYNAIMSRSASVDDVTSQTY